MTPPEPQAPALIQALAERHGGIELVAERLGFDLASLTRWEAGVNASPNTIRRLRQALAAPLPWTGTRTLGTANVRATAAQARRNGA